MVITFAVGAALLSGPEARWDDYGGVFGWRMDPSGLIAPARWPSAKRHARRPTSDFGSLIDMFAADC